jgi:hypothetical protein
MKNNKKNLRIFKNHQALHFLFVQVSIKKILLLGKIYYYKSFIMRLKIIS